MACSSHNECWDHALVRYQQRKEEVERVLKKRQDEYVAAKKLECLWDSWEQDSEPCVVNESKVKDCMEQHVNITNLTIPFPPLPDPSECDTSSVEEYPCTDEFLAQQYLVLDVSPEIIDEIK